MIRQANSSDLDALVCLAKKTREHMLSIGLNQWVGDYPNLIHFQNDLNANGLYLYIKDDIIYGSVSILPENDPPYQIINWTSDHALVVHRLFVDPDFQMKGVGQALFQYAQTLTSKAYQSLKVDTHPDNHRMQALIKKMGFEYKGYIASIHRYAYEWVPNKKK